MNPSSFDFNFSAVQSQKDMYKWLRSMLVDDEGLPSTIENIISERQQVTGSLYDIYRIIYQLVK